ncbi:oxidoreductase [Anoxybacterium hadale]|uniref:Oxidoreductase n=1 Tax=Anoxybacterium hadale TaxID=3408580 RepID=A0ACD1AHS9_9FIRM|nr:oxidoreductase [Clostridiales bacterium]
MEFNEVIKLRRSIRKFKAEPIPDEYVNEILKAGRLAPSVSNIQSTRYLVIKNPEVKEKLNEYTVPFVKSAPVVIVCCAYKKAWNEQEKRFLELKEIGAFKDFYEETKQQMEILEKEGKVERMANPEIFSYYLWQHAAIAIDHMMLKAVDLGLGSCWVGFVDREKVRELVNLDNDYDIIALLPIGYPSYNPAPRSRFSVDQLLLKEL